MCWFIRKKQKLSSSTAKGKKQKLQNNIKSVSMAEGGDHIQPRSAAHNIELRIRAEVDSKPHNDVHVLYLNNCIASRIPKSLNTFVNLKSLFLGDVGLETLEGFPKLPHLELLYLSNNKISGQLELLLTSPRINRLDLSCNKLNNYEVLEPLKHLKHLVHFDVSDNDLPEQYSVKIFEMFPSVKYVDGYNQIGDPPQ